MNLLPRCPKGRICCSGCTHFKFVAPPDYQSRFQCELTGESEHSGLMYHRDQDREQHVTFGTPVDEMLERMANDLDLAKHLIRNLNSRLCEFVPYEDDANRPVATGKQSTDMVFQISTTVWDYRKMKP